MRLDHLEWLRMPLAARRLNRREPAVFLVTPLEWFDEW
jgi:hypothetical protein